MGQHEVAFGSVGRSDALLTYMQDLLAVLDEAGAITYASPSYQAILGYAPTTLLNAALLNYVHADDQAAVRYALTSARAQADTPATVSYRHRHADGSWRTIQATLHNRLADPALGGIVAVGRDLAPVQAATATARLRALQEVTDAALTHLSLDALLRTVLERTTQVLRVDNTAILLLDEEAQELVLHVAHGTEEEIAGQVRVPLGQGIAGRIAATGEPLIVDDMAQVEAVNPFLRERIRSLLGVPLRLNGLRIGVLHVGTLAPHRFTAEDLQWLQLVADRVALAIAHADLYEAERGARERASAQASELAAIFEAIGDPVLVYDREGRLLRTNAAAQALNRRIQQPGYADLPYAERVSLSLPRDAEGRPASPQELPTARVLRGERFVGAEAVDTLMRGLDGRDVLLNVTGVPIHDTQGQISGAVVVARDVTAHRELERRTHQALEALLAMAKTLVQPAAEREDPAASGRPAAHGVAQRLVELTREVLGCTRVGIIGIEPRTGVQHPLAVAGLSPEQERLWRELIEHPEEHAPQPAPDPALLARFLAGEVLVVDMTTPPFRDQPNPFGIRTFLAAPLRVEGAISGSLTLDFGGDEHAYTPEEVALTEAVADLAALVIERERLLRERAEAQASELALREVNRRMDEFLSIATHELRSPLTGIRGSLQLAQRRLQRALAQPAGGVVDPAADLAPMGDLLRRADDLIGRLARMIADLLDVARIQTDQLEVRPALCDLAGLVRRCVGEAQLAWPDRTIVVEEPDRALLVQADEERIGQVLANYLTNALKYSTPDRPVAVGVLERDGMARVEVRDRGPGLSAEQREAIWERYRRMPGVAVQDTAHGPGGGLGLGLYISRMIIAQHGGEVGVTSAPGVGSTFSFTLPLAAPVPPDRGDVPVEGVRDGMIGAPDDRAGSGG